MIERYAAWGICFSDYLIFFNNHEKKKRVCMPDWLKRLLVLFLNSVSWSNRYESRVLTIRQLRLKEPWCISHCTVNGNSRRLPRSAAITCGTALTEITRQSHFWCLNLKSQGLRISPSQHWLWQTDASRCCDYTNKPWFTKTVPWNHVWHPQTKSQCLRILQSQHPSCCAVAIPSERSLILKVQRKCSDNYLSYRIYSQINPPVHSFKLRKKSNCSAPRNSCSISLLNLHCEHFYGFKLTTFQSFRKWSVPMYST